MSGFVIIWFFEKGCLSLCGLGCPGTYFIPCIGLEFEAVVFLKRFLLYLFMCVGAFAYYNTSVEVQGQLAAWFSPSTMWILWIILLSPGSVVTVFTSWDVWPLWNSPFVCSFLSAGIIHMSCHTQFSPKIFLFAVYTLNVFKISLGKAGEIA